MKQRKIIDKRSKYSFEQKIIALKVLMDNDYNYAETGRDLSLVGKTVQRWEKKFGDTVYELLEKYRGDETKITEEEVFSLNGTATHSKADGDYSDKTYYQLVRETKVIAVKRLGQVLLVENNMQRIVTALKLLEKISEKDPFVKDRDISEESEYYKLIRMTYNKRTKRRQEMAI